MATALVLMLLLRFSTLILTSYQQENQFIYNGFQDANLQLDGSANIHPNGLLQLTNTSKQEIGHAFYRYPVNFKNASLSFSTSFIFAIVPELEKVSGHGIALTISPSMDFSKATASQYLGLFNLANNGHLDNHIFAVELDTVKSPEFQDISENHVGIDSNSLISVDSASVTFFSEKEGKNKTLELISGDISQIWIDYDGNENLLNLTIAPTRIPKPRKPLLSTRINLSSVFLDSMYIGFSSSTGVVASNHYILGWSFNKSGQAQDFEMSKLPSLPKHVKTINKQSIRYTISLASVTVVLIIAVGAYTMRRKKYGEVLEDWEQEYGPQRFSYKELYKATQGFKEKQIIGRGGFGRVYRGVLPSSEAQVAVKRVSHDSDQGMREFVAEIASMRRLRHRNLVQLLGYCRRKGELLLVYDYMPNGSLDKFLFDKDTPTLDWFHRYRIIKDIASSLLYLHEDWEQVVLHRDVKANNVLLDSKLNGRLGDFGLARLHNHGTNAQTTNLVGTVGYLAPELTQTGRSTTNTDVFSFGAFMLETVCGRRPIEQQTMTKDIVLTELVFQCWKRGNILEAIDPRLEGKFMTHEVELVLKLGLLCSHYMPMARPNMRQVMQYLNGDKILSESALENESINILGKRVEASTELTTFVPSLFKGDSSHSLTDVDSILYTGR